MSSGAYVLGDRLRLEAQRCELSCDGSPVELKRKAVEVLCALAEADGALVTKDDLLARLWPGQVVEENNLQVHVSSLRKALERCGAAAGGVHLVTVPGKGYRLLGARSAAAGAAIADPAGTGRGPLLAVLPFDTFGADDVALLAQGTVEEISLGLSRVRWLSVVGGSSVAVAHAHEADPQALARSLGAEYLVQGSLRRQGERVRIVARLCRSQGLQQLWCERYERALGDLFALQDEIAASVVSAIEPGIEAAELARIRRKRPADLQAYEGVLRALPSLRSLMPHGAREALVLLDDALARDPGYAWAQALQAWCHHVIYSRGGRDPAHRTAALAAARSAVSAGADDPLVLATSGLVLWFEAHELARAFDLFDRALALSPGNVLALAASSVALAWSGQAPAAAERAARALRLHPFHPLRYLAWQGLSSSRLQQGDAAGALDAAARAVEANPGFSVPLAYLCAAQAEAGQAQAARDSATALLALDPGFTASGFRAVVGVNPAVFDRFARAWKRAGVPG